MATTYYFDSVNGSDSNLGTSESAPKKLFTNFNGYTPVAGDTVLIKRGTTQTITGLGGSTKALRGGNSESTRIRYAAYGEAQVPYSIWRYGTDAGNIILNAASVSYLDFEDMYFDMSDSDCRNSIYFASQGANECAYINIRRCFFKGSNSPTLHFGNGLGISAETSSTVYPHHFLIEDSEFFDNDSHGLFILSARHINVRRSRFYRNGANDATGGHGFSARYRYTATTTGWALTGGTVYQRSLSGAETDVYYIQTSFATYPRLLRTAEPQTAPLAGEFGVAGGILYVNLGTDANNKSIVYAWGMCSYLTIEDCESYDNYWNRAAPYHEGHGFAFDDFTDLSKLLRNKAYNNDGCGFSINRGSNNVVHGNLAYNNHQAGLVINVNSNCRATHNTFIRNNQGTDRHTGEIHSWGSSSGALISNNLLVSSVAYGVSSEATDASFTGANNCITGHTTGVEKTAFLTGTVTSDPDLDGDYRPNATAVANGGSYVGGLDFFGKELTSTSPIGCMNARPSRLITDRSINFRRASSI